MESGQRQCIQLPAARSRGVSIQELRTYRVVRHVPLQTKPYLIPAGTALSKIVYQSEKLNGTPVPVSDFILWPYAARSRHDGYRVVAWAHGTSGANADHAPSYYKNLCQHFLAPYQLALQGYVVIGTDYAGLGVQKDASGASIMHEYLASPSQGNDIVYSVNAARVAFPELFKNFVVIGHSQGGGAAWAVAQRAASSPIPGSVFGPRVAATICGGIASSFSDFNPQDILTPEGEKRISLMSQTGAGVAAAIAIVHKADLVKPDWRTNPYVQKYGALTGSGGKPIQGPLLVIHGEADAMKSSATVKAAVEKTARVFPSAQLEAVWLLDVGHAPALGASQRLWMDWIVDRFNGLEIPLGHRTTRLTSPHPSTAYHKDWKWYLETASQFYQTI